MSFFSGMDAMNQVVKQARARKAEGRNQGLWAAGEHVLGVSNESVPHEEGDFEATGGVSQDEGTGLTAISYRDTAYPGQAAELHENASLQHDDGRNAKFLELALASEREVILAIAGEALKRRLGMQ